MGLVSRPATLEEGSAMSQEQSAASAQPGAGTGPATSPAEPTRLKRTPLFAIHRELGARLVEFGGWEMPVQYSSIIEEHKAVRERAGLFDVSHMGEFLVHGPGALDFLQEMVPNNVARLVDNQALYTQTLLPSGGTVDDLIIYRLAPERYMVVVNAGTMEKDWAWFTQHAAGHAGVTLENISNQTALLALQGPRAQEILQPLTETAPGVGTKPLLGEIKYYWSREGTVAGTACRISRTGYTGEDGFELYCAAGDAPALWRALMRAGEAHGLLPAGLGARDTLRLEAGYCLYGHELSDEITPLEAGLGWSVKLDKGADFSGREALVAERQGGLRRKLVGIEPRERGIPREGYPILASATGGERIGTVTSGTMSPTFGRPVALGYVPPVYATPGTELAVEIRGKPVAAVVVALPFFKRAT
jgi:aminomethyltransferase